MSSSAMPAEPDLRTLAGIVSDYRADLAEEGLPLSLLAELMGLIRCEVISFQGFDSGRQKTWFVQDTSHVVPIRYRTRIARLVARIASPGMRPAVL
jgi:hypothetical protein